MTSTTIHTAVHSLYAALKVITLTKETERWLEENDPMTLLQCKDAVVEFDEAVKRAREEEATEKLCCGYIDCGCGDFTK